MCIHIIYIYTLHGWDLNKEYLYLMGFDGDLMGL